MNDKLTKEEELTRDIHADIMSKLLESERFRRFFHVNFDLHKVINEDDKTIEYRLIEVPPSIAQERLSELVQEHAKDNSSNISPATMQDLEKIHKLYEGGGK